MLGYIAFAEDHTTADWRELDWEAPASLVWWVMRFVADQIQDDGVSEMLHFLADNQMQSLTLDYFTHKQRGEIVRVLVEALPGAVSEHSSPKTREHLAGLVERAKRWAAADRAWDNGETRQRATGPDPGNRGACVSVCEGSYPS
ncbi:hypothetical protein AB0A74_00260 [Saccharothrix sp. NPDC042600]|uniref:hypothetical protein n=1 Tax=Saccharothrix TaxID=2071 RepID=UPI0033CD0BED|nr:hypothetical protein GCM10017745_47260 [Saccharothrix mutabilis subsp. capreolus]